MEKRQKKIQTTTPSNVVLSFGILVDTTCQPRDGWPAPTNLVWTWISITCWVVKSSLVKLGVMVCDKRHITSTPLWTPGRSSHTWLGGTGKTPAVQVFWSIFPINFTKQKKINLGYLSLITVVPYEMNPRKPSIMDRVGCYRTQYFSVVVVHTCTLPFIPHPHCNHTRTRTHTQTLWKCAVQMST